MRHISIVFFILPAVFSFVQAEDLPLTDAQTVGFNYLTNTPILLEDNFATTVGFRGDSMGYWLGEVIFHYVQKYDRVLAAWNEVDIMEWMDSFAVINTHPGFASTIYLVLAPAAEDWTPNIGVGECNRPYFHDNYFSIITSQFGARAGEQVTRRPYFSNNAIVQEFAGITDDFRYLVAHWFIMPFFGSVDTLRVHNQYYPQCKRSVTTFSGSYYSGAPRDLVVVRPDRDGLYAISLEAQPVSYVLRTFFGELISEHPVQQGSGNTLSFALELSEYDAQIIEVGFSDGYRNFALETGFDAPYIGVEELR